jgi:hypothetical protein
MICGFLPDFDFRMNLVVSVKSMQINVLANEELLATILQMNLLVEVYFVIDGYFSLTHSCFG